MAEMAYFDADMIVWLDETGNDQRSKEWTKKLWLSFMKYVTNKLSSYYAWKRLSTIAIMSTRGIEDFDTYDEAITGDVFGDFIDKMPCSNTAAI